MSTPDIERLLASVPTGLWIGGEERPATSTYDVLDPSNDEVLTKVGNATAADAIAAVLAVTLIAGVTSDLTGKLKAGELVNFVAQQVGGKGGGRPDMAQAGGPDGGNAAAALSAEKPSLAMSRSPKCRRARSKASISGTGDRITCR